MPTNVGMKNLRNRNAPAGRDDHEDTRARILVELMRMPDRVHPTDEERGDAHPLPVSRRRFLQRSAMAVAGGALFSCTGGRVIRSVAPSPTTSIDTRWPIKQVIYVMMENRSFDNMFGRFPGVNGTTVGVKWGEEVPLIKCPDWLPGDLPHDRAAALNCLNGGKLDGFAGGAYGDPWSYSQFQEHQLPNYWHWAREYALSDNFYASALGPSYPNHYFFIAGQSGGVIDNPENIVTRSGQGRREAVQELGMRRARRRRVRAGEGRQREPHEARFLLQLQDGGRAAHRGRHGLALLLPRSPGRSATSGTRTTGSTTSSTPTCGTSTRRTRWIG